MTGTVQNLIAELKRDLDHLYGKRLQGLVYTGPMSGWSSNGIPT